MTPALQQQALSPPAHRKELGYIETAIAWLIERISSIMMRIFFCCSEPENVVIEGSNPNEESEDIPQGVEIPLDPSLNFDQQNSNTQQFDPSPSSLPPLPVQEMQNDLSPSQEEEPTPLLDKHILEDASRLDKLKRLSEGTQQRIYSTIGQTNRRWMRDYFWTDENLGKYHVEQNPALLDQYINPA